MCQDNGSFGVLTGQFQDDILNSGLVEVVFCAFEFVPEDGKQNKACFGVGSHFTEGQLGFLISTQRAHHFDDLFLEILMFSA